MNELATPLSVAAALGAVLLDLGKDTRLRILNCARTLAVHIAGRPSQKSTNSIKRSGIDDEAPVSANRRSL